MAKKQADEKNPFLRWQRYPLEFIYFMWPELEGPYQRHPERGLSRQQIEAFEVLGALVRAKFDIAGGAFHTDDAVKYGKKIGISIQSGNGSGKDFWLAIVIIWFTFVFKQPKNVATANTATQLHNVLWSEIAKLLLKARKQRPDSKFTILQEMLEIQKDKLFRKEDKGLVSFTAAVTVDTKRSGEEQAQSIAGYHEDFQLVAVDEGSNIADPVFQKLERTLTRMVNIMVIIFNPLRSTGYAIESQTDPRFIAIRWNCEESPIVTPEQIASMAKYGRDSNSYRVGVLGLPPLADKNILIPFDWVEDAFLRDYAPEENDPIIGAMDCGGGGNKSVLGFRKGFKHYPLKYNNSPDSNVVEEWALQALTTANPDIFFVDKGGLGHHIFYRLKKMMGSRVKPIENQRKASDEDRYYNLRAEMYSNLREVFENKLISLAALPEDQKREIRAQLGAIKTVPETKKIQIIKKSVISKELGAGDSPDEVDQLAMMYAKKEDIVRMLAGGYKNLKDDEHDGRKVKKEEKERGYSWMGV